MKLDNPKDPGMMFWWLVFPAGTLVALLAQLVSTACGLGLTFDSRLFLAGAAFFNGDIAGGITEQAVFQAKPPLFSWLLSWLPFEFLPYLMALLLVVNLLLLARIISAIFSPGYWRTVAFLAIAFFTPFIMVHVYLWTEPVFLVMLYAAVLIMVKGQKADFSKYALALLGVLAILMILTRHVGLFFVIGLALALSLGEKSGWQKALLALMPALLVFAFWNFGLMGEGFASRLNTFVAPVSGGTWSRLQNFQYFAGAAATWFVPNNINLALRIIFFILLLSFIIFGPGRVQAKPIRSLIILSITYYLLMHFSFLIDESSADRYLAPIYPLLIIVVFYQVANYSKHKAVWLRYLVALWLLYPATRTIKNSLFWQEKICQENNNPVTARIQDNSYLNGE